MNRYLNQFRLSFEKNIVEYFLKVSIGSTGAPTIVEAKGVTSVTRNSAGKYTILLADPSAQLKDVCSQSISGTSPQAAPLCTVVSEAVATAAAPTVVLQYYAADNSTATDPASGEVLLIRIAVRNSSK